MASEDYYGTRSMRLLHWGRQQKLKMRNFYDEVVEAYDERGELAAETLDETLEEMGSVLEEDIKSVENTLNKLRD